MEELLEQILTEAKAGQKQAYEDLYHMCLEALKTQSTVKLAIKYLTFLSEQIQQDIVLAEDEKRTLYNSCSLSAGIIQEEVPVELLLVEWRVLSPRPIKQPFFGCFFV